jgi:hypothetical protein
MLRSESAKGGEIHRQEGEGTHADGDAGDGTHQEPIIDIKYSKRCLLRSGKSINGTDFVGGRTLS